LGASALGLIESINQPSKEAREVTLAARSTEARSKSTPIRLLLALAALATLFALAPQSAAAGTYVMRSCNVPGQAPAPVGPWAMVPHPNATSFDNCAQNGGFGVTFPSTRRMTQGSAIDVGVAVPDSEPDIELEQIHLWMVARLNGSGSPVFLPLDATTTAGSRQRTETWGPPGGSSLSQPIVTPIYSPDTRRFTAMLYCSTGSPDDCFLDSSRPLEVRGAQVTLRESRTPTVRITGGTLGSGGPQSGTRSVGYDALDEESGVAKVEILLDDAVVKVRDLSANASYCPHESWNACSERLVEEVAVDTRAVSDGTYTIGVRVSDAAGNRTVSRSGQVVVQNATPNQPGAETPTPGAPPAEQSGMRITHMNSSRTLVTERLIRYGSRATLRGVLRDAAGQPMPNTQLDVVMRTDRKNSWLRKVATRTTDSNGRFEYKTPSGPSRLVRFGYGATSAGSSYTFTHDVKVNVRSGVRMSRSRKSLRNGQRLRLYGTIQGIKQRKVVEIQVRKAEGWDTIASVRSNSKGRWSWRYRFERTYKPTRYQFRARVRTDEGFPYATGYSPSRSVRVR
jgi:hypothetical protein